MADLTVIQPAVYGIQAYGQNAIKVNERQKESTLPPQSASVPAPGKSEDPVSLSKEGKELSAGRKTSGNAEQGNSKEADANKVESKGMNQQPLDEAELRQVQQLRRRDTEVRAHEQAHLAAAGQYAAGGPSYSYQTGPDGRRYAVGGSVPIDMGEAPTPAATIQKMRTVKRAALAPAKPSAADRRIAAQASMNEMKARQELASQQSKSQTALTQPPEKQEDKNIAQEQSGLIGQDPAIPSSHPGPPSATTQKLTAAAYQAMASLA